jgi:MFS family permease
MVAVLSLYFIQMGVGSVTPALASIAASFPGVPITTIVLIATLANLVSVPATIIAGRVAGSVIKYKTLLLGGMILLPEPEKAPARQAGEAVPKMPKVFYTYAIGIFVTTILFFPLMVSMSSVIEAGGMGNAAVSGMVLTMYTVGGVIAGFAFPKFFGTLKQNTIPVILCIITAAMACVAFGNTLVFMYAAATLGGIGLCMMVPTIFTILGMKLHPAQIAIASGLIMGFMNGGGFISAYVYALLAVVFGQEGNLKFPFYVAMICFAIGAIGLLFVTNAKKNTQKPA